MRKGRVAFLSLIMVVVMTAYCFAFEIGGKAGLHEPQGDYANLAKEGATFGFQMKNSLTDLFSWGVHVGYGRATTHTRVPYYMPYTKGEAEIKSGLTMIELYPFVDFNLVQYHWIKLFLRGGVGINIWDAEFKWNIFGEKETDSGTDVMTALGMGMTFFQNFEVLVLYNMVYGGPRNYIKESEKKLGSIDYLTFTIGYNYDFSSKIEAQF